ncbi:hypothetical protein AUP68_10655 [Ilyonectria robusta]
MEKESLADQFRRQNARNRENVALAGLNIRPSVDIFEDRQKEYENARTGGNSVRREIGGSPPEVFGHHNHDQPNTVLASLGIRTAADILEAARAGYEEAMANLAQRRPIDASTLADLGIRTSADIFEESQREYELARRDRSCRRERSRKPGVASSSGRDVGGAEDVVENSPSVGPSRQRERERPGPGRTSEPPPKRARTGARRERGEEEQVQELAGALRALDEEFAEKERLSHEQAWCASIPHDRKVSTVQDFYKAFHDYSRAELKDMEWDWWMASPIEKRDGSPFKCLRCFPVGEKIHGCAECVRHLGGGGLSPAAQLHTRLGCEHTFPDELKDLTPVEEKLISLNSCYGFITKYSISDGHRQGATYPRHVKGHITVFPNNVQELATNVLPHPLLKVMDDIHVSWQGQEKPAPSDLSALLSVRRSAVEKALAGFLSIFHTPYGTILTLSSTAISLGDAAFNPALHALTPLKVYDFLADIDARILYVVHQKRHALTRRT